MRVSSLIFTLLFCFCSAVSFALDPSRQGQIDDVGGIPGKRGFSGDGSDASQARLSNPMGGG